MSAGVKPKPLSDETARAIDLEVRSIIDSCYDEAKQLLEDNIDKLHMMADALMEFETINSEQIDDIMAGAKPRHPSDTPKPPSSGENSSPESPIGGPAEES